MTLLVVVITWVAVAAVRTPALDPRVRAQFGTQSLILWDNYTELAGYHLSRGEFLEADAAARKAITIRHDGPAAYWYSGIALLNLGRETEAAQQFRQVLRFNPSHPGAQQFLTQLEQTAAPKTETTKEKPATDKVSDWRVP